MILSCIAVDDEPLALQLLVSYIEQTPSLRLVAKYSNAIEALKRIGEEQIDVVFLDIRMHGLSGMELAKVLAQQEKRPKIVFTTAYDQYALESYQVEALDYLLKPFSYADFSKAVLKAIRHFEPRKISSLEESAPIENEPEYLYLKVEYQMVRIALQDILYLESDKDYIKVYVQNEPKPILSLTSMKAIEEKLPKDKFMRIHRSFIVSLDKIKAATKGTVEVSSRTIPVTEQYREAYMPYFQKWQ